MNIYKSLQRSEATMVRKIPWAFEDRYGLTDRMAQTLIRLYK